MNDYEFYFEAQTGTGSETVICKMQYETHNFQSGSKVFR